MDDDADMNTALMVDGNAVAGRLQQIFERDMTTAITKCVACAREAQMGALMAFIRGPGVVLRCPSCEAVIARIVETATAIYLDARGTVFVRMELQLT
jgi:tRNA pseudouridine-54 N-methylase